MVFVVLGVRAETGRTRFLAHNESSSLYYVISGIPEKVQESIRAARAAKPCGVFHGGLVCGKYTAGNYNFAGR